MKLILLAAILLLPTASAAVTITDVEVPERTSAGRAFPVDVTLRNDGPARTVHLFGALYDAGGTCGPATDPRFRTFTHLVQDPVELPAQSETRYPGPDARWMHRYDAEDAGAAPEEAQLCIFVANASSGPLIDYEDFEATALSVRATNAPPSAGFTWSPASPVAGEDVTFTADSSDPEGDPVTLRWDFGYLGASGRAQASGSPATTRFYPAGAFSVTLTASDGIDFTTTTHSVRAYPDEEQAAEADRASGRETPVALMPWVLALAAVALLLRPPARCR